MNKELTSEFGQIKVHKRILSQIAENAASEIKGVRGTGLECYGFLGKLLKLFGLPGARVSLENEIRIIIPIVVAYGTNVTNVAHEVQRNIVSRALSMLNIDTLSVDVKIKRIERG